MPVSKDSRRVSRVAMRLRSLAVKLAEITISKLDAEAKEKKRISCPVTVIEPSAFAPSWPSLVEEDDNAKNEEIVRRLSSSSSDEEEENDLNESRLSSSSSHEEEHTYDIPRPIRRHRRPVTAHFDGVGYTYRDDVFCDESDYLCRVGISVSRNLRARPQERC